jgi:hypothetical protein
MPSGGGTYDGGDDTDTFRAVGANSSDAGTIDIASGTRKFKFGTQGFLNFVTVQVAAFNTGNYSTGASDLNSTSSDLFSLEVGTSATLTSNASQHLLDDSNNPQSGHAALLITHSGKMVMASNGSRLLNVNKLNIPTPSNGSILDLKDNDLRTTDTSLTDVKSWLTTGFNSGGWNGNGIQSSAAASEAHHATALGYMTGSDYRSVHTIPPDPTFDGETITGNNNNDVLVKYTWYGDTDFTGTVTFDDYIRTDNGSGGSWFTGDFNYTNTKNFDDYVLIDTGFNNQTGTL